MTEPLAPQYDPDQIEAPLYAWWQDRGLFRPEHAPAGSAAEPYVIMMPPPNVTAELHAGHGLNNTVQDVLVRFERMRGRRALWLPGTDHAGIATQNVVERLLAKEGLTRFDLGREAFVERVWSYVRRTGATILEQLKAIGCSADWSRTYFTLDEGLSRAVRETFVRLYEKGLVYRGHYIINWCPRCLTALSNEEAEKEEVEGRLWHLRYPLADGSGSVVVATTRPETMLGDTAVAVHPDDERYRGLIGREIRLPLVDRLHSHRRRRRGRPVVRLGGGEGHARSRPGGLRDRPPAPPARHRRDDPRGADEPGRARAVPGARPHRGAPPGGGGVRGRGAPGQSRAAPARGGTLLPLRDGDRTAPVRPVVREDGAAGPARPGPVSRRHPPVHPRASGRGLRPVAGGNPRLVHLPSALVGAPHSGVVLRSLRVRPHQREPHRSGALPRLRRPGAAGRGRARHLVQLLAGAVLQPRLARPDR